MCNKTTTSVNKSLVSALSASFAEPSTIVRAIVTSICGPDIESKSNSGRNTYNDRTISKATGRSTGYRIKMFTKRSLRGAEKYALWDAMSKITDADKVKVTTAQNGIDVIVKVKYNY